MANETGIIWPAAAESMLSVLGWTAAVSESVEKAMRRQAHELSMSFVERSWADLTSRFRQFRRPNFWPVFSEWGLNLVFCNRDVLCNIVIILLSLYSCKGVRAIYLG